METQNEEDFNYTIDRLKTHKYILYRDKLFYKILDKMFQSKYDKIIKKADLKKIDVPARNPCDIRTAPNYEKIYKKAIEKQEKKLIKHKIYKKYFLKNNSIINYIINTAPESKDISCYKKINSKEQLKKDTCFDFYITKETFDFFHQNAELEYLFKHPIEYLQQYLYINTKQDEEDYKRFFYSNLYLLNLKEKIKITRRASTEQLYNQICLTAYPEIVLEYIRKQYLNNEIQFVTCWKHKIRIPYIMSVKVDSIYGKQTHECLPAYSCGRRGKNDKYNSMNRWVMEAIKAGDNINE